MSTSSVPDRSPTSLPPLWRTLVSSLRGCAPSSSTTAWTGAVDRPTGGADRPGQDLCLGAAHRVQRRARTTRFHDHNDVLSAAVDLVTRHRPESGWSPCSSMRSRTCRCSRYSSAHCSVAPAPPVWSSSATASRSLAAAATICAADLRSRRLEQQLRWSEPTARRQLGTPRHLRRRRNPGRPDRVAATRAEEVLDVPGGHGDRHSWCSFVAARDPTTIVRLR